MGNSFALSAAAIRKCGTLCGMEYFDPQLTASVPQERCRIDDPDEDDDRAPYTDEQVEWVKRSQDHFSLALFMKPMSVSKLLPIAVTIRMGLEGDHLPYPRDFVARKLRTFSEDEQAEAWELFGKGVEP
jgi:hypothetical protein